MNKLRITTIQTNVSWEDKKANLAMLSEKIARSEKSEIVVLPEMFSTGFSMNPEKFAEKMEGETVAWMRDTAFDSRKIITGSLMIEENGNFYNRLVWMLPNGNYGYYDKRHLFAFAHENQHYTPGDKRLVASVNGWKINLLVCYDLRFPVWSRQQIKKINENETQPEYDVIIYVANWPIKRIHAWKTLLMARAIENQCFVVGVNRVGVDVKDNHYPGETMVIDPMGELLYHAGDKEEIHTSTLDKDLLEMTRNKFPFWKDADIFSF